jgi:glycosyltransferase involved in cell wall biosynthesis
MNKTLEILESQNKSTDTCLRIIQFGPTLYQGGVAVAIKQLSLDMARLGHKVMLIGNGGEGIETLIDAGVNYQQLNWSGNISSLLGCVSQVRQHLKSFRPNIVHVHGRAPSLVCRLAGRQPDWFTMHNTQLTDRVGLLDMGLIRQYFSPLGNRVFALNQQAADYLTTKLHIKPESIKIIPNGIDCKYFRPPIPSERAKARLHFGIKESETMALFVGRFHEQKQPEAVVALAAAARNAGLKDIRFILVGTGPVEEEVRQRIRALELEDICQMHNWMDPLVAYWAADMLLMPSLYEGFGFVAAEALACGCPVLRTKTGGYELMIREGVTGFGCETNQDAFVAKGLEVLQNRDALQQIRPTARLWAEEQLGIRRQTEQTLTAYRDTKPG